MTADQKRELAEQLLAEAGASANGG
jgi:hypothetical protein